MTGPVNDRATVSGLRHKDLRDAGVESATRSIHGERGRTASTAGFGEYAGICMNGAGLGFDQQRCGSGIPGK